MRQVLSIDWCHCFYKFWPDTVWLSHVYLHKENNNAICTIFLATRWLRVWQSRSILITMAIYVCKHSQSCVFIRLYILFLDDLYLDKFLYVSWSSVFDPIFSPAITPMKCNNKYAYKITWHVHNCPFKYDYIQK
jgi:hypothetical protein